MTEITRRSCVGAMVVAVGAPFHITGWSTALAASDVDLKINPAPDGFWIAPALQGNEVGFERQFVTPPGNIEASFEAEGDVTADGFVIFDAPAGGEARDFVPFRTGSKSLSAGDALTMHFTVPENWRELLDAEH